MKTKEWFGIMKVLNIQHFRKDQLIWEENNIANLLHLDGEQFVLRATFTGGQVSSVIPSHYFLGLDNRQTVLANDSMISLIGEPSANGYARQAISSSGDFAVTLGDDGHFRAVSPIIAFQAIGHSWGPVRNLFLTDRADNSGTLISTAAFPQAFSVLDTDSVTMRIAMSLRDCPP